MSDGLVGWVGGCLLLLLQEVGVTSFPASSAPFKSTQAFVS